jgi:hypothetical protein
MTNDPLSEPAFSSSGKPVVRWPNREFGEKAVSKGVPPELVAGGLLILSPKGGRRQSPNAAPALLLDGHEIFVQI